MELTQRNYSRFGSRHISTQLEMKTVVYVEQNTNIDNPDVWDVPYIFVHGGKVTELKQLDLLKDALDMAGELFEKWSEDTGKEIAL